jgi:ABC-type multidrug transport system ATPase subunit
LIRIELEKIGKRHQHLWTFRGIDYVFEEKTRTAITGFNGSGKSTLLQIISGYQQASEGKITFTHNTTEVATEKLYKLLSIGAPYIDLPEELSIEELITFFAPFKEFQQGINTESFLEISQLKHARNKSIKQFSSGMKQRLKLAMAILSDTPMLLLDEPLSNLDANGVAWYKEMIDTYALQKTTIVASNNIEDEIYFCSGRININDYKK